MSADTEALLAKWRSLLTQREQEDREADPTRRGAWLTRPQVEIALRDACDLLDSLAAELERLQEDIDATNTAYNRRGRELVEREAELERVKAERDGCETECEALQNEKARLLDRLDKALAKRLAEIEGKAASRAKNPNVYQPRPGGPS